MNRMNDGADFLRRCPSSKFLSSTSSSVLSAASRSAEVVTSSTGAWNEGAELGAEWAGLVREWAESASPPPPITWRPDAAVSGGDFYHTHNHTDQISSIQSISIAGPWPMKQEQHDITRYSVILHSSAKSVR